MLFLTRKLQRLDVIDFSDVTDSGAASSIATCDVTALVRASLGRRILRHDHGSHLIGCCNSTFQCVKIPTGQWKFNELVCSEEKRWPWLIKSAMFFSWILFNTLFYTYIRISEWYFKEDYWVSINQWVYTTCKSYKYIPK